MIKVKPVILSVLIFLVSCQQNAWAHTFSCLQDIDNEAFADISLTDQIDMSDHILLLALRDTESLPNNVISAGNLQYSVQSPVVKGTFEILEIIKGDTAELLNAQRDGLRNVVHEVDVGADGVPTHFDAKALTYFARHKYAADYNSVETGVTVFDTKWRGSNAYPIAKIGNENTYIFFCGAPLTTISLEPVFDFPTDPLYLFVKNYVSDKRESP